MFARNTAILALLLFAPLFSWAQNRVEYFKVYPVEDANMPAWARLMYEEDPNVKEVQHELDAYVQEFGFQKNTHTQNYKHWIRIVEPWVDAQGHIRKPTAEHRNQLIDRVQAKRQTASRRTTSWTPLGPFETFVQGSTEPYSLQVNVYSMDIYPRDPSIMICGTETGTVFYSNDKALSWETISDHAEFNGGVTAVKIHPEDPAHFFAGVDSRIYESTDGGAHWTEIYYLNGSANEFVFDPLVVDHMYCSASSGLFESQDGGMSWMRVLDNYCYDVVFHPTQPQIVYALMENPLRKRCELYKSPDFGFSWGVREAGWYTPADPDNATVNGGKIGVSQDDPDRVYACLIGSSKPDDNGWIGIYRSDDAGENWYHPAGQDGGPYNNINTMPWNAAAYSSGYHQGYYNFDLEVSPNNADLLWFGTIRLCESSNGGYSYVSIGSANSTRLNNQHADIQDIEVIGNDVWVASDGGINYSNDNQQSSVSRKAGINGSDFWGFGSGWNEDVLVGGKYHNGNSAFYQTYPSGIFHHVGGVEESTGYVHPIDNRKAYFNKYWAGGTETVVIPDQLGAPATYHGIIPYIPNESYLQSWSSGFFFDPRYADHIYMGEGSTFWKSVNGGSYFEALHDFGLDRRVLEIKISRANPDIIYTVVGGPGYWDASQMYRSEDGGRTWTLMTGLGTDMWRIEIDLNPENESEIWASANSGSNGNKVYQSLDKGQSWINKTTPDLDGENFRDLFYQAGSGGVVYLASHYSIHRYDPASGRWENCSDGLPFIPKGFEMRPFYRDQKLRIGTYGKGIWETDLEAYSKPLSQPMTHADKVYCTRDTVRFDCYSILDHTDASWEWTFSPEPMYVSDVNARNPKVVFGGNGKVDVSLKITDGQGNSSEKMVPSMVEILNHCNIDTIAGQALRCYENGDYAQTADFNKTISELTVTAWVKPDGIQDEFSGIFMHDGEAAGFNFKNNDNSLAYHWPGGQWWWNSGLTVQPGVWSHVAMVVRPTLVTLYVNGEAATQNISLQAVTLNSCKIGSYKGWDGRNFRGSIDEVAVWDRALSTHEVRRYRHLTKEDFASDPNFLAYYQFNAPVPKVLDRISNRHADLSRGAEKLVSNGPFGGGVASSLDISSTGSYLFAEEGVQMQFEDGVLPMGEVYISRIDQEPNISPNEKSGPGAYWILNNYGTNTNFTSPAAMSFFPPSAEPGDSEIANPSLVQLFSRGENDESDSWSELCDATDVDEQKYTFGQECRIQSAGQYQFRSDTTGSTATEDPGILQSSLLPRVYPNPIASGKEVFVRNRQNLAYEFLLIKENGAIVRKQLIHAYTTLTLETKGLSPGAYFYSLKSDKFLKTGTLIVE